MTPSSESQLQKIAIKIARLNELVGRAIAWLTLAMVLVTFVIVVLRYVFNMGWIALQESVTYMHACVFLLAAAYTLKQDGHVRVDIFYRKMSPRKKALVDLSGTILFLLPLCCLILWSSWDYVAESWKLKESSQEAGGLPFVYLLKSTLIIMPTLLIVQACADILRQLLIFQRRDVSHKVEAQHLSEL